MKNTYSVFTDGSCWPNDGTGVGGWAYILMSEWEQKKDSGGEYPSTNNRMELLSALNALLEIPHKSRVTIFSDSQYVVKTINTWIYKWVENDWYKSNNEKVNNIDILSSLFKEIKLRDVKAKWIKGHNGNKYNEMADSMAHKAMLDFTDEYLDRIMFNNS